MLRVLVRLLLHPTTALALRLALAIAAMATTAIQSWTEAGHLGPPAPPRG